MDTTIINISHYATIIIAITTVITIAWPIRIWYFEKKEEKVRNWQCRVVFKLLPDRNTEAFTFDKIRQEYLQTAMQLGMKKKEALTDDVLYDVIMRLLERNLIFRDAANHSGYRVFETNTFMNNRSSMLNQSLMTTQFYINQTIPVLARLLSEYPKGIEKNLLRLSLKGAIDGINDQDIDGLLISLKSNKTISEVDGKISLHKKISKR